MSPITPFRRPFPAFRHRSRTCRLLLLAGLAAIPLAPPAARAAWESEMAAFAAQDQASPPQEGTILFTGSSSITGWSSLAADFPGFPVRNRGFGGSQMNDVLTHFTQVVTPARPALIVVYEGDNDIWAGETPSAVFAEYVSFADRVKAELPHADILILAVKPSPSRVSRMAAMAELNTLLREFCESRPGLRFADVYTPMLDGAGQPRPELFGPDMLHLNAAGYALWKSIVSPLLAEAPWAGPHSFRFDFGAGTDPAAPGWNIVSAETGGTAGGRLSSLQDLHGTAIPGALEILSPFNAANTAGTTSAAVFPPAATRDTLFGNTELFEGRQDVLPAFRLSGLNPELAYRLTFYASRSGVADNRSTRYTVTGGTTATTELDAAGNHDRVAIVSGLRPDTTGSLTVSLSPGPANNSPNHFTYLGVLKVDGLPPPPPDTTAPLLTAGTGRSGGTVIELTFSEPLDAASATQVAAYTVNGGAAAVTSAVLLAGGRSVSLTLAAPVSGAVTVAASGVKDLSGNPLPSGAQVVFNMPAAAVPGVMLFDFGAAGTGVEPAEDSGRTWNNIGPAVAASDSGVLATLVTAANEATTADLRMIRRFNAVNTNGTSASGVYPPDATSDSFYGNTESFGSLSNIFPAFKITGLDPSRGYDFTFYASRLGVSDNRETRYTVGGRNTVLSHLQVAGNISRTASASGVYPDAAGDITVSLAPGANNNNANHFTYLAVMVLAPAPPPDLHAPRLENGRIRLDWTGAGHLHYAENPAGPWNPVLPAPTPPWTEELQPAGRRFYRLHRPAE